MLLPESKLQSAVAILREQGARRVLLFGSYATDPETARDLDLAVEGIPLNRLGAAELGCYRLLCVPLDLLSREGFPTRCRYPERRGEAGVGPSNRHGGNLWEKP